MEKTNQVTKQSEAWWQPGVKAFSEVTGLMVLPIVAGLYGGRALDTKYGTEPWLFITCSAVGLGIAALAVANLAIRYMKESDNSTTEKSINEKKES